VKWLKRIAIVVGILAVIFIGVPLVVGSFMPREHVGKGEAVINAPIGEVWKTASDYEAMPSWWRERRAIKRIADEDGRPRFEEKSDRMSLDYVFQEVQEPKRLVVALKDSSGYFGGTWTYELAPVDNKTRVTITEQGWTNPAFFRFMMAVFGADATIKSCLAAMQKKHGG